MLLDGYRCGNWADVNIVKQYIKLSPYAFFARAALIGPAALCRYTSLPLPSPPPSLSFPTFLLPPSPIRGALLRRIPRPLWPCKPFLHPSPPQTRQKRTARDTLGPAAGHGVAGTRVVVELVVGTLDAARAREEWGGGKIVCCCWFRVVISMRREGLGTYLLRIFCQAGTERISNI